MVQKNIKPLETFAKTEDGWRLAAYHYPRRTERAPVIMIHGLGTNRYDMDFPFARLSLAKYLHRRGYDVWNIELRGAGKSQPVSIWRRMGGVVRPSWNFDDHVFGDIPAFLKHIREQTGRTSFHWIGHSLGGSLIYAAVQTQGNEICQSAVTIASAMNSKAKPGFARLLIKIEDRLLQWVPLIPGRYLSKWSYPAVGVAAPLLDNFYYCLENIERRTLRKASQVAVENISVPLFLQLHRWYRENEFSSLNGDISYHANLKHIKAPWLVIAGSVDGLTPLPDVYYGYEQIRSRQKKFLVFGKEFGHKADYGHLDLVMGRHAPREVYPQVVDWLNAHDPAVNGKRSKKCA